LSPLICKKRGDSGRIGTKKINIKHGAAEIPNNHLHPYVGKINHAKAASSTVPTVQKTLIKIKAFPLDFVGKNSANKPNETGAPK